MNRFQNPAGIQIRKVGNNAARSILARGARIAGSPNRGMAGPAPSEETTAKRATTTPTPTIVEHADLVVVLQQLGGARALSDVLRAVRVFRILLTRVDAAARRARLEAARAEHATVSTPLEGVSASFSPREQEVLAYLKLGMSEKEIAGRMAIRTNTVHHYVKKLYQHLGVCSRGELLSLWVTAHPPTITRRRK